MRANLARLDADSARIREILSTLTELVDQEFFCVYQSWQTVSNDLRRLRHHPGIDTAASAIRVACYSLFKNAFGCPCGL